MRNICKLFAFVTLSACFVETASAKNLGGEDGLQVNPHIKSILYGNARLKPINTLSTGEMLKRTTLSSMKKTINKQAFTFTKYLDGKGNVSQEIKNGKGIVISEKEVPAAKIQIVEPEVSAWVKKVMQSGDHRATLEVDIALSLDIPIFVTPEVGVGEIRDGQTINGKINGDKISPKELNAYSDRSAAIELRNQLKADGQRMDLLKKWASAHKLADAKGFKQSLQMAQEGLTLSLTAEQLYRLIKSEDKMVVGIEKVTEVKDTLAGAMSDTNIASWALPYNSKRGNGVGIFMTESGCAQDFRITNYDRLAGSETNHSRNVGAIIRGVSPESYIYCRGGAVLPNSSDLDGVGGNDPIYILTRSNGGGNSNYSTLDRSWDNYSYSHNLAIFNAAGNNAGGFGDGTSNVIAPAKGLNVTAVGNYNDANDTISASSSFIDPKTGNDKPEISAPGSNITAGGFTMSGTSMSCPHAAGFTADMMSNSTYLKYRPYLVKAKIMAGATDSIAGGNDKVGLGGIDFRSAQYSGYWSWWAGGNNSWDYFDRLDSSDDGYVTRRVYISAGWDKVQVALAWMNRGTYTYNHRNNAHAIGMDLDLSIYGPTGGYVGGSYSWDNPYESVKFTPTVSGYYTFKVKRYANRDTRSVVKMGMYVNYYN